MHHLPYKYLHHVSQTLKCKELLELYMTAGIRTFALSLVAIFIPIYMLTELNLGMNAVFLYLLIWAFSVMLSAPLIAKMAARIGFKNVIFLSLPTTILYIILLQMMKTHGIHYAWIAVLSSLSMEMFWIGFHMAFAQHSHKRQRGEEVSFWFSGILMAGVVAPFFGALVIQYFGFKVLFAIAALLMLVSMIPLLFNKTQPLHKEFSVKRMFGLMRPKDTIIYSAYGIKEFAASTFWPLAAFFILKDVVSLGTIFSIVMSLAAVFSLVAGRMADHKRTTFFVRFGALIDAVTWPIRYALKTFLSILSVSAISSLAFVFVDISAYKKYYDGAASSVENIALREIYLTAGRIIVTVVILALGFNMGFWLSGLSNLAYLLL